MLKIFFFKFYSLALWENFISSKSYRNEMPEKHYSQGLRVRILPFYGKEDVRHKLCLTFWFAIHDYREFFWPIEQHIHYIMNSKKAIFVHLYSCIFVCLFLFHLQRIAPSCWQMLKSSTTRLYTPMRHFARWPVLDEPK